ncbi:hypothetical protein HU200_021532 [Digitaria exilis]|uniref:Uncharacterized protein n=1 Tax=Digitaria exilis TaxID=1010633 RepID=A0A835KBW4_9POAL|nr:hypothetical protein HU200_021532 [Digitaria exilis]
MGNCQAAEAATVVVQHPGGRVERLYWATSAAEVMRSNPGHYVALVTHRPGKPAEEERRGAARVTRVKLLKPKDTLLLGQAYRLITVAEVTKALQAKKEERTRRAQQQPVVPLQPNKHAGGRLDSGDDCRDQVLFCYDHHPFVVMVGAQSLLCFLLSSVLYRCSTYWIRTSMH